MSWALGTPYAQDTRAAGVLSSGHRVPRMPFVSQDADSRFHRYCLNRINVK